MTSEQGITITWLGHATTRIQTADGKSILLDPWLETNPKTPDDQKRQDRVDLMLITHAHVDHMADAVSVAQHTQPDVICINELAEYLQGKGVGKTTGFNKGGTVTMTGKAVVSADGKSRTVTISGNDASGKKVTSTSVYDKQ